MKTIPLSVNGRKNNGKYGTIVSEDDYEWASQFSWAANRCSKNSKNVYAYRHDYTIDKRLLLHREIWMRASGQAIPDGWQIDHKNCLGTPGLDNRRENLRIVSPLQNGANARSRANNVSGYKGVFFRKDSGKWRVQIHPNGRHINVGQFDDPLLAALAFDMAAVDHWGEFARTNFDLVRCI